MVTITTTGSSVIFEFENCPTYLQNGTIEVPKNALSLTLDNSNMATFRKAASNDIFVSVSLDELDMDEEELMEVFAEMCSTGGGGSAEEIQELSGKVSTISGQVSSNTTDINTISGQVSSNTSDISTLSGQVASKADTSAVTEEITAAVSGKADTSSLTAVSNDVETLSGTVTSHTSNNDIHVTTQDKTNWNAKADASDLSTLSGTVTGLSSDVSTLSGTVTSHTADTTVHVTSQDKTNWDAKADASDLSTLSGTVTGLSSDVSTLSGTVTGISNDVSTLSGTVTGLSSDVSTLSGTVTSHTSNSDIHVTSTDKTAWDGAVTASTANTTALGGVKLVKITQSAYDQLQTKDPDTLYIITAS